MAAEEGEQGGVRQIAVYGKGGIGKSTVVSNVSAALRDTGRRVLQVGCDPKHDSSRPFWNGARPRTILDLLRATGARRLTPAQYVMESPCGVHAIEVGGPEPGVGCAGRGILKMFELLRDGDVVRRGGYDAVLYDVLGDVVCGGFAAPLKDGHARDVVVVLSGEYMALFAANNICRGIARHARRRDVRLAGLVLNHRDVPEEAALVGAFAEALGTHVLAELPRSPLVSRAERHKTTVVDRFPDSPEATGYRRLAADLLAGPARTVPTPLDEEALEALFDRFQM